MGGMANRWQVWIDVWAVGGGLIIPSNRVAWIIYESKKCQSYAQTSSEDLRDVSPTQG